MPSSLHPIDTLVREGIFWRERRDAVASLSHPEVLSPQNADGALPVGAHRAVASTSAPHPRPPPWRPVAGGEACRCHRPPLPGAGRSRPPRESPGHALFLFRSPTPPALLRSSDPEEVGPVWVGTCLTTHLDGVPPPAFGGPSTVE